MGLLSSSPVDGEGSPHHSRQRCCPCTSRGPGGCLGTCFGPWGALAGTHSQGTWPATVALSHAPCARLASPGSPAGGGEPPQPHFLVSLKQRKRNHKRSGISGLRCPTIPTQPTTREEAAWRSGLPNILCRAELQMKAWAGGKPPLNEFVHGQRCRKARWLASRRAPVAGP